MVNFPPMSVENTDRVRIAASVAMSYLSNNTLPTSDVPQLLTELYDALLKCDNSAGAKVDVPEIEKPTAAQIRKSITLDALISFIDGKPYKSLKRHICTHGFTPQSYRARYGLPDDYPMVTKSYAAKRSAIAKSMGFGLQPHMRPPKASSP